VTTKNIYLSQLFGFVDRRNNFLETKHCHVRNGLGLGSTFHDQLVIVVNPDLLPGNFPNLKKSVSDILVGRAGIIVYNVMDNVCNLVHKHHDIDLQNFCNVSKISDIAETKHSEHLFARQHGLDSTTFFVFRG
jgi:hypothetical protein